LPRLPEPSLVALRALWLYHHKERELSQRPDKKLTGTHRQDGLQPHRTSPASIT
jgi:hypothetical protein